MKFRNMLLAGGFLMIAIGASGCGKDESKGNGAVEPGGPGGAGGAGGAGGDGGVAQAKSSQVRIGHLSPDAPAVDACLIPAGGAQDTAIGPIFKNRNDTNGIEFGEVSSFIDVPAGQYSLRLVEPNAQNCETALAGTMDQAGLTFREGAFHTAAVMGEVNPAGGGVQTLEMRVFDDDLSPEAGQAKIRFIHASPDAGAVDVGTVDGQGTFTPIFSGVGFAQTGAGKGGENYVAQPRIDNATIAVRPAGQDMDLLTVPGVTVELDRVVTLFAVGSQAGQKPLGLLVCQDERPSLQPPGQGGSGAMTSCKLMP